MVVTCLLSEALITLGPEWFCKCVLERIYDWCGSEVCDRMYVFALDMCACSPPESYPMSPAC